MHSLTVLVKHNHNGKQLKYEESEMVNRHCLQYHDVMDL